MGGEEITRFSEVGNTIEPRTMQITESLNKMRVRTSETVRIHGRRMYVTFMHVLAEKTITRTTKRNHKIKKQCFYASNTVCIIKNRNEKRAHQQLQILETVFQAMS